MAQNLHQQGYYIIAGCLSLQSIGALKLREKNDEKFERFSKFIASILPGLLSKIWKLLNRCSNGDYHNLQSNVIIATVRLLNIVFLIVFENIGKFTEELLNDEKAASILFGPSFQSTLAAAAAFA